MNISLSSHRKNGVIKTWSYKNAASSKKNDSAIDALTKQKEDLKKSKNAAIKEALEQGEDSRTLKAKLEEFDKKIADIDKQIDKIQMEDKKNEADDKTKSTDAKNKSRTTVKNNFQNGNSTEQMQAILSVSGKLKENSMLVAQKASMSSEINVLKSDIQFD